MFPPGGGAMGIAAPSPAFAGWGMPQPPSQVPPPVVDDDPKPIAGRRAHSQKRPGTMPNTGHGGGVSPDEPPKYVPYTVEDYKKINVPVRLGGLGPNDSDEVRLQRELKKRAKEYGKEMERVNLLVLQAAEHAIVRRPLGPQPTREAQLAKERREKSLEFAKHVPRPKVPDKTQESTLADVMGRPSGDADDPLLHGDAHGDQPAGADGTSSSTDAQRALAELEARHKKDQEMMEALKRQLKLDG